MKDKGKIGYGILATAAAILLALGFFKVSNRLTYVERVVLNGQEAQNIAVMDSRTEVEQEFRMPYDLFWGIDVKTGTYDRNNNSFWRIWIWEKESGKKIYEWKYNASQVSDGEYYFLNVKSPVKVDKEKLYVVSICSTNATGNSALSFYASEDDNYTEGRLFVNGKERDGDLCFSVYGGEKDSFWGLFYWIMAGLIIGVLSITFYKKRKGEPVDRLLGALAVACIYMILMYVFTRENMGSFTDECDNIRGGVLIAKGKVLYRDYYTQHTPFGYYLCALFALLGAGSIQQFRLLYYLLLAALWGGLYYRHSGYFGKGKLFLLPVAQIVVTMPMFFQASKILGDNIQGFCMIALVMEFIRYWEDGELKKSRCAIVAACVFISITSTFVSVFAIAPVAVCVLGKEVLLWIRRGGFCGKNVWKRYGFLVPAMFIPFLAAFIYFLWNHAAGKMYLMAYQFNTMVYNKYQDGFGRVKWKPFFLGVKNYFNAVGDNFNALVTAAGSDTAAIQLCLAVGAAASLLLWWKRMGKKEGAAAVLALFLCMCGNGTRSGTDFHSAGLWNVAIVLVVLLGMGAPLGETEKEGKRAVVLAALAGCFLLKPYMAMVAGHIVYEPEVAGGVDMQIIAMTEPGDEIFIDAFVHDSIYLLYKERYPSNRNCYILPWYMDWFEYDTLEDVEENLPKVAIYKPETEVYGHTGFCPVLDMVIKRHYERVSEESIVWKLR